MAAARAASASTPFNEGYLAAAAFTRSSGRLRCIQANPYPLSTRAADVWREGWNAWNDDLEVGMTPPSWRI